MLSRFHFLQLGSGHLFSSGESNCFFEQLKTRKKSDSVKAFLF